MDYIRTLSDRNDAKYFITLNPQLAKMNRRVPGKMRSYVPSPKEFAGFLAPFLLVSDNSNEETTTRLRSRDKKNSIPCFSGND